MKHHQQLHRISNLLRPLMKTRIIIQTQWPITHYFLPVRLIIIEFQFSES